ncbi:hypothetical protein TIFTF001_044009 [Ficus carica]|uniref:Uncharacterized protein n=1 Tax=Ficus carica TaxID=3494 RepID=A0AA87Z6Q4_FICCA|nr:hypothetical protein TIFTF001_044009 [Ficus carica]
MGGGRSQKLKDISLPEREELKAVNRPPTKQQMVRKGSGVRGNSKTDSSTWGLVERKSRGMNRNRGMREHHSYREHRCKVNQLGLLCNGSKGESNWTDTPN